NGAGKTTLFNAISRFVTPTTGQIVFDSVSLNGVPSHMIPVQHGIARTFQELALFDDMSVADSVMMGCHRSLREGFLGAMLGFPSIAREESEAFKRVCDLMEFFEIAHLGDEPVKNLSYG